MPVPYNERNFWVEIDSSGDGLHDVGCGPSAPDGTIQMDILMRCNGKIKPVLSIQTGANEDKLELVVFDEIGNW